MEKDYEHYTAAAITDWPDLAMAAIVALVVFGIPLLTFLFR
jgi:hypothetical protein